MRIALMLMFIFSSGDAADAADLRVQIPDNLSAKITGIGDILQKSVFIIEVYNPGPLGRSLDSLGTANKGTGPLRCVPIKITWVKNGKADKEDESMLSQSVSVEAGKNVSFAILVERPLPDGLYKVRFEMPALAGTTNLSISAGFFGECEVVIKSGKCAGADKRESLDSLFDELPKRIEHQPPLPATDASDQRPATPPAPNP